MFGSKKGKDKDRKKKKKDIDENQITAEAEAEAERKRKEEEERKRKEKERKEKERRAKEEAAAERKRKEEERKRKEKERREQQAYALEMQQLSAIEIEDQDLLDASLLHHLPGAQVIFSSYDVLQNFARDLNVASDHPEIVFVGPKGHGKSSVLEGIFGHAISATFPTTRPIVVNMVNALDMKEPRVIVKRDSFLTKEFPHDVQVPLNALCDELKARSRTPSEHSIVIQYESPHTFTMTLIDLPGLPSDAFTESADQTDKDDGDDTSAATASSSETKDSNDVASSSDAKKSVTNAQSAQHKMNATWLSSPRRWIVAVERAADWDRVKMKHFIQNYDPEFSRTTFVYTNFFTQLQNMSNTRQLNRYLSGRIHEAEANFFTTLPSKLLRAKFSDSSLPPKALQEKFLQYERRDVTALEQLQYDKENEQCIGVLALRNFLYEKAWKTYQKMVPRVLNQLRTRQHNAEMNLKRVQREAASLDCAKLRQIASRYVVNFLQIVERLIAGTSEGNPQANGQTLKEEKQDHGDGDWYAPNGRPIRFDPSDDDWAVPYWNNRLYGGQQFERLLAEFRAVADHIELPEISMDDVATSSGINKLNNIPNYAWAASDLAQQKSSEAFIKLIDQLCSRAVFIMQRVSSIAEQIMVYRSKPTSWDPSMPTTLSNTPGTLSTDHHQHHQVMPNDASASSSSSSSPPIGSSGLVQSGNGVPTMDSSIENVSQYKYLTFHVKNLYDKFVQDTAAVVKKKCMDEFYSTRTIYWDLTELNGKDANIPIGGASPSDTKDAVTNLAAKLFDDLRERITKNVLLKFYNFFLVPIQTELWNVIQGDITCMSDKQLEQKFEVHATRDNLKDEEMNLEDVIQDCQDQEVIFLRSAKQFSHPVLSSKSSSKKSKKKKSK